MTRRSPRSSRRHSRLRPSMRLWRSSASGTRALNALERLGSTTVRQLVEQSLAVVWRLPGVGRKTRREIATVATDLKARFPNLPATLPKEEEDSGGVASIDTLAVRLMPKKVSGGKGEERILPVWLGLNRQTSCRVSGSHTRYARTTFRRITLLRSHDGSAIGSCPAGRWSWAVATVSLSASPDASSCRVLASRSLQSLLKVPPSRMSAPCTGALRQDVQPSLRIGHHQRLRRPSGLVCRRAGGTDVRASRPGRRDLQHSSCLQLLLDEFERPRRSLLAVVLVQYNCRRFFGHRRRVQRS